MQTYSEMFPDDELACLAQTFINIEVLGNKYPPGIVDRVELLASRVPEIKIYRQLRQGRKTRAQEEANVLRGSMLRKRRYLPLDLTNETHDWNEQERSEIMKIWQPENLHFENEEPNVFRALLKDVIYFEIPKDEAASLNKTKALMKRVGKVTVEFPRGVKKCCFKFNDRIVGQGVGNTKELAKNAAHDDFIHTVKTNCHTIKKRQLKDAQTEPGDEIEKVLEILGAKFNDERVDNVAMQIKITRNDLLAEMSDKLDQRRINRILSAFKRIQTEFDLVFKENLSKEDRAMISQ